MGLNPYVVSFFVDFAARWAASPFRIKMLGMAKPFLRRGFACGKTLERRKSGAALKGRFISFRYLHLFRQYRTKRKTRCKRVFLFGFRPPKAASTLRD